MIRSSRRTNSILATFIGLPILCALSGCHSEDQERLVQFNSDGVHLFHHGEYKGAEESFQAASELAPNDADILYNLGRSCARQGKWAKAEKHYRACLTKQVNHAECRHALVTLMYQTGRQTEADNMIRDWLIHSPNLAGPYVEDGWRLRRLGELQQAMGRFQQALAKDPKNLRALTEMGRLYEQMNLPDRALLLYQRALSLHPGHPELTERVDALSRKKIGQPRPQW